MQSGLSEARARWGAAHVLPGGRDVIFLLERRAEIVERLMARGLTAEEAEEAFRRGLAAARVSRFTGEPPRAA